MPGERHNTQAKTTINAAQVGATLQGSDEAPLDIPSGSQVPSNNTDLFT